MRLSRLALTLLALSLVSAGCGLQKISLFRPPPPIPAYHGALDGVPMRRVAMLPLCYDQQVLDSDADMDVVFNEEFVKTSLFEVVTISRADMEARYGQRQFSSVEVLPGDLLARLRADYGVDGVLFTDVTHYFPYRPVSIGVRMKLVDVRTGRISWAFDHLFDSGVAATGDAAKHFFVNNSRDNYPIPTDGSTILQSPSRFSKYVAWEVFRSMKTVPPAAEFAKAQFVSAD